MMDVYLSQDSSRGRCHDSNAVILAQEIKLAKQRRRVAKLESALLQLRENAVLAYERILAEDT